ncbi:hypothetical protein [Actinospongicola halichondriae]|uniref:hypothetical protein n=1 Tax=Actinospongicola halichondriae TaxID=3236844 RepID=UPI003D51AED3
MPLECQYISSFIRSVWFRGGDKHQEILTMKNSRIPLKVLEFADRVHAEQFKDLLQSGKVRMVGLYANEWRYKVTADAYGWYITAT